MLIFTGYNANLQTNTKELGSHFCDILGAHLGLVYKKIGVKMDTDSSGVDIHVEPVYLRIRTVVEDYFCE